MATELWLRNPALYIKEAVECEQYNYVFDRGVVEYRRLNLAAFLDVHVPAHAKWRAIVVDDRAKIAVEYTRDSGNDGIALHPVYTSDMDLSVLEKSMQGFERVIFLQTTSRSPTPAELTQRLEISQMQLAYPNCILHVKNSWSFATQFGMDFRAADVECRTRAANGVVFLTQGGHGAPKNPNHLDRIKYTGGQIGMDAFSLDVPRNRCMWNIRVAAWAAKYYKDRHTSPAIRRTSTPVDIESPEFKPLEVSRPRVTLPRDPEKRAEAESRGDYFLCNLCSQQTKCDYFRRGAVCALPGSEPSDLAKMMGSTDAETIKAGLSSLLMFQSNRVLEAAEKERDKGEIDPELTKMVNTLFDRGVKMVKLQDPAARNGGPVINLPGSHTTNILNADRKAILGGIIQELEARGVHRNDVTPEVLLSILSNEDRQKAIDGVVIASKSEAL